MMKVMLAAIEIFSLVYQRIFAQKSPDTKKAWQSVGVFCMGNVFCYF